MTPKLIRDFISVLNERRAQTRLGFMSYNAGLASTTHFCTLPATCCTAMLKQHRGPRGPSEMPVVVARRPSKLDATWSLQLKRAVGKHLLADEQRRAGGRFACKLATSTCTPWGSGIKRGLRPGLGYCVAAPPAPCERAAENPSEQHLTHTGSSCSSQDKRCQWM